MSEELQDRKNDVRAARRFVARIKDLLGQDGWL
jgi:hypothetical protein